MKWLSMVNNCMVLQLQVILKSGDAPPPPPSPPQKVGTKMCSVLSQIPYRGKFLHGENFRVFH